MYRDKLNISKSSKKMTRVFHKITKMEFEHQFQENLVDSMERTAKIVMII